MTPLNNENDIAQLGDPLKKWATWGVVIGTAIWTTFFFGFLVISALSPEIIPDSWFLDMIKTYPAGTIGVAISAVSSFSVVAVLDMFSRDPIAIRFFQFELKGAAGPVLLWAICFIAFVSGANLLWKNEGIITQNETIQPTAKVSTN